MTFWTEDLTQLFNIKNGLGAAIIPSTGKTLPENLNVLTRLGVLISIAIACFNPVLGASTLAILVLILIAINYAYTEKQKEKFTELVKDEFISRYEPTNLFCNDTQIITHDEMSNNQKLLGPPNPKTLIPPIVAPRSHDLEVWKASDYTTHSHINDSLTNFDLHNAGYSNLPYSGVFGLCPKCAKLPCMCIQQKAYSDRINNLTTQTIQPGLYYQTDMSEPINSMIGISEQKQFNPIIETQRYPNIERARQISRDEIYDPRFSGYGPDDRGYLDPMTGSIKFFYDDIDSITMPNFISRNKVDIYPWALHTGSDGNRDLYPDGLDYREAANREFTNSALKFRTEMQERLMRKRNAEMWQRRSAPITTMKR